MGDTSKADQELKQAVSSGEQGEVSEALENGGNAAMIIPEYSGYRQVNLIQVAAIEGFAYLIDTLKRAGANCNHLTENGLNAVHLAARFGHIEVIKELDANGNINISKNSERGLNAIHIATIHGHAHVVKEMAALRNVSVNDKTGNSLNALHLAAQHGQTNMLKVLVDLGMNVNRKTERGLNALHIATQKGHTLVMKELVTELGMDVHSTTENGFNALHLAAQSGQPQVMDELIKLGMNINSATRRGQKANHLAASSGHPHVLGKLKDLGMDINTPADSGWTAVHFAVKNGQHRCVEMLGKLNASLDMPDRMNVTPLMLAVKENKIDCMEALRAGGANISAIDLKEEVFYAVKDGNLVTLRFLIDSGLDPTATDRDGRTPLQWAERKGDKYIVNYLTKKIQERPNNPTVVPGEPTMDAQSSPGPMVPHSSLVDNSVPGASATHVQPGLGLVHTGQGNIESKTVVLNVTDGSTVNFHLGGSTS